MRTLLLADHSVTIQRVIELTFAQEDVRVVSVSDGRRALQWIDAERPDIVLADVGLPDVDGYAVAAHVKGAPRLSGIPVLLLAGAFEPVDQERVRAIGCDGVLVKPFEPEQLVARVRTLLDRARPHTAPADTAAERPRRHGDAEPGVVTPFPAARSGTSAAPFASAPPADRAEPSARPAWDPAPPPAERDREPELPSRVSLANAFAALLAAEQSSRAMRPPPPPPLPDAVVDEAVRRALVRMTEDTVRRIVVETAERLIREEIEKLKATPE